MASGEIVACMRRTLSGTSMFGSKNSAMTILSVPVADSLALEAGACVGGMCTVTIFPPSISMFDQLLDWLSRQAPADPEDLSSAAIGIGATALCLRWGTYLAVLLDERKPIDPRAVSPGISMISDSEMKRINLEFCANLARLVRMLHEDERGCRGMLHLASENLTMPRLLPARCDELLDLLLGLTSLRFWNSDRVRPLDLRRRPADGGVLFPSIAPAMGGVSGGE